MNIIMKRLIPRTLPMFIPGIILSVLIGRNILSGDYFPLEVGLILGAAIAGHFYWQKLAKDYIEGRLKE